MAESINTLAGLIQFNDMNLDDINPSDLVQGAPLLQVLHAKGASNGTQHKHLVRTLASSSAFRAVNAGLTKTYSQDTLVTIALKVLDGSFDFDKALLMGAKRGDVLNRELVATLQTVFFDMEQQIIYGVGHDSGGFAGLADNTYLATRDQATVVQAGTAGTTADSQTSVYLIRSGPEDISVILGEDGNIEVGDPYEFTKVVNPGTDNKTYTAVGVSVLGWAALQYGSKWSAGRICNIETALTDDDFYAAFATFPGGRKPNIVALNPAAAELWRKSRTATNALGSPAPLPEEIAGMQVVVTDGITSTEAIVAAS